MINAYRLLPIQVFFASTWKSVQYSHTNTIQKPRKAKERSSPCPPGLKESLGMTHADSLLLAWLEDEARRQVGVEYSQDHHWTTHQLLLNNVININDSPFKLLHMHCVGCFPTWCKTKLIFHFWSSLIKMNNTTRWFKIVYNLLLKQIQSRRTAQYTRFKQPPLNTFWSKGHYTKGMSGCQQQGREVMSLTHNAVGFQEG